VKTHPTSWLVALWCALPGAVAVAAPDGVPGGPAVKPATAPTAATPAPGAKKPEVDPLVAAYAAVDAVDAALQKAVESVRPCSVTIWNEKKRPGGDERSPEFVRGSGGSGVFISWKGKGPFLMSNEHVVRGADRLEAVTLDGSTYEVRLKDHVKDYDIALLEFVKDAPKSPRVAKFGKSEALKEGQWVFATGNPFFLGGDGTCVATLGVISGLDRTLRGDFTYANAIQHDTEVNPGNSGGPLWNLDGEFLGINGMISTGRQGGALGFANTGISFSIPIHLIAGYLDALLSDKAAAAGSLGLDLADEKDKSGKPVGAKIRAIRGDSAVLRKSGPKGAVPAVGDVITRIWLGPTAKSYDIFAPSDLTNAVAFFPAGTKARVRFQRGGRDLQWEGELGAREGG
jgi:S1-C subfamily serine protease